jgi:hypothetical protein
MQAYDLVKLRSTASCRIVRIAAASKGGAIAGVIGTRQSRMIGESDHFLSGDFLTPSPPAKKTTARQQQARQASTGDG